MSSTSALFRYEMIVTTVDIPIRSFSRNVNVLGWEWVA